MQIYAVLSVDSFVFLLTVYRPFRTNGAIPPTISANRFEFVFLCERIDCKTYLLKGILLTIEYNLLLVNKFVD